MKADDLFYLKYDERLEYPAPTDTAVKFRFGDRDIWFLRKLITQRPEEKMIQCPLWLIMLRELEGYIVDARFFCTEYNELLF